MTFKEILDLTSLEKGIASLNRAINVYKDTKQRVDYDVPDLVETLRAGVIQSFEFTYELSWKFMKRWVEENGVALSVDGVTRRELFRIAAEHLLINDVDQWMSFHKDRNLTSHTYDEETAESICAVAFEFREYAEDLLAKLQEKNS